MSSRSFHARLALNLLLILLPVLGGGGYFCLWGAFHQWSIFTLTGLLLVVCLISVVLIWLLIRRQFLSVWQLADELEKLRNSNYTAPFSVDEKAPLEMVRLRESIDALRARLLSDLKRERQFTAEVSHELRTPLTVLRGETEMALRRTDDSVATRETLISNLEELERMSQMIDNLLLLSKSKLGEMPLQFEQIDLIALLEDLHQQGSMLGKEKRITVDLEATAQELWMQGDPLRLRQLVLNILTNAIKYTPAGGHVQLSVSSSGTFAEIRISDTGIGIDPRHQQKIFDHFYRVDKARKRSDGGSGLGLSISRRVAEGHGGTIEVHSISGQGSEFLIVLPLKQRSCA